VKKLGGAALIAAVMLSLAGCASAAPAPETTTSTSAPAPTPTPERSALDELQAAYVAAGGQCDTITPRTVSSATDAGDCDGGALLTTYSTTSQRDAAIRLLEALQDTNPSPYEIAVGDDWIVNGADAGAFADAMGGEVKQIGDPAPPAAAQFDLTTDAGLCAADAEMTNLELNDAIAPLLGFPADRDARTYDQDDAIRAYKNAAFERECPARAG
jgi:hypothetical protein